MCLTNKLAYRLSTGCLLVAIRVLPRVVLGGVDITHKLYLGFVSLLPDQLLPGGCSEALSRLILF